MRATSIQAFRSLTRKDLNKRQKQVLEVLRNMRVANNREISEHANMPINTVTPRTLELVQKKIVTEAYRDKDSVTGRTSIFWKLAE